MSDLSNSILEEYLTNLDSLPFDKKFHFASRLYLWNNSKDLADALKEFKAEFTADNNPKRILDTVYANSLAAPVHGSKNASELRTPYFEKYPTLKTTVLLLFRITFMLHIYGIDARSLLFDYFSRESLDALENDLRNDKPALAILSTHAVNFIYLYNLVIKEKETVSTEDFFKVVDAYNLQDPIHLQLYIYLFTHCIIGQSKFYYQNVEAAHKEPYLKMQQQLEKLVADHFVDINMDNKFEYLVCCKILGTTSKLEDKIFQEAERSLSENGCFIIDRHNNNPQAANIDLPSSEHRNVLYIMSRELKCSPSERHQIN